MNIEPGMVSRRALKRGGVLDAKVFYRQLAEQCGYVDEETIRRFYLALVKVVTRQLRDHGAARLPHLGDFVMAMRNEKLVWAGKVRQRIPAQRTLKFLPQEAWKQYLHRMKDDRS